MNTTQEKILKVKNGWGMLAFTILLLLVSVVMIFVPVVGVRVAGILMTPVALLFFFGHFTLQPNEAMVLLLFGDYRGTEERNGFFWANPFFTKSRISK
ncbi:MAG TPA: SPFH domain-containing protein, partial [Planctomycetes bacterium]|nr:SPFH domain-containing protein [Planctomycetota bacterium]